MSDVSLARLSRDPHHSGAIAASMDSVLFCHLYNKGGFPASLRTLVMILHGPRATASTDHFLNKPPVLGLWVSIFHPKAVINVFVLLYFGFLFCVFFF